MTRPDGWCFPAWTWTRSCFEERGGGGWVVEISKRSHPGYQSGQTRPYNFRGPVTTVNAWATPVRPSVLRRRPTPGCTGPKKSSEPVAPQGPSLRLRSQPTQNKRRRKQIQGLAGWARRGGGDTARSEASPRRTGSACGYMGLCPTPSCSRRPSRPWLRPRRRRGLDVCPLGYVVFRSAAPRRVQAP